MRVIGFGTYDVAQHPRMGVLLQGLLEHGDDVSEVNAPLGITTAERVHMLRVPWRSYRLVIRLVSRWGQLARQGWRAKRSGAIDAVIVGYLGHFDVLLARVLFPRTTVVLEQLVFAADTARDRGTDKGVKLHLMQLIDRLAVAAADLVIVDTDENRDLVPPRARHKVVVVLVGAGETWFAARSRASAHRTATPGLAPTSPLRVVFYGLFTPLQGTVTIAHALAALADAAGVHTTMIGSGQQWAEVRAIAGTNPRIDWVDWVDAGQLPDVVAAHDVCLGVFGTTPKAHRVVPNKVYQGAAAGCAIVTSDTAPQRRALGDAAAFVSPGDAGELAITIRKLGVDRERLAAHRRAALRRSDVAFTPSAVVLPLRTRLLGRREPG
jgi:glycosyltransferase involved in cell wall biosynthesis